MTSCDAIEYIDTVKTVGLSASFDQTVGSTRTSTRRRVLGAVACGLVAGPAWGSEFAYGGWRFKTDGVGGRLSDALVQSLQAQVEIVESLNIDARIKTFFRDVPMEIVRTTLGGRGAYSFDTHRMELSTQLDPPQNPVLLHELLHAYHDQKLPGGTRNGRVIGYFNQAKSSGAFPFQSYMLSNRVEFFAMCASVVLWGRAARPPSTRANVRETLPEFYAWTVEEFSLTGV